MQQTIIDNSLDTGNPGYKKLSKAEQNSNHNTMTKPIPAFNVGFFFLNLYIYTYIYICKLCKLYILNLIVK